MARIIITVVVSIILVGAIVGTGAIRIPDFSVEPAIGLVAAMGAPLVLVLLEKWFTLPAGEEKAKQEAPK